MIFVVVVVSLFWAKVFFFGCSISCFGKLMAPAYMRLLKLFMTILCSKCDSQN